MRLYVVRFRSVNCYLFLAKPNSSVSSAYQWLTVLARLVTLGETLAHDADCISDSFPGLKTMQALGARMEWVAWEGSIIKLNTLHRVYQQLQVKWLHLPRTVQTQKWFSNHNRHCKPRCLPGCLSAYAFSNEAEMHLHSRVLMRIVILWQVGGFFWRHALPTGWKHLI